MEVSNEEKLKGIGGWLGLYIFFGFFNLIAVSFIFFEPSVDIILGGILLVLNAVACFMLIKKNRDAVKWIRRILLATMSFDAAFLIFHLTNFTWMLFSGRNYYEHVFRIANASSGITFALIWFMYFGKSVRVKVTFPDELPFESSNQLMRLLNRAGWIVVFIYLSFSFYSLVLKSQMRPIMRESFLKNGSMSGSDIFKNSRMLQKEFLRKLWDLKH